MIKEKWNGIIDSLGEEVVDKETKEKKIVNEVKDFLESEDFNRMKNRIVGKGMSKHTCDRCNARASEIYPKDLKFLMEKSSFPFDYAKLCDDCASLHVDRLLKRVGA